MKLNEKQIEEVKLLYGDNVDAAEIALDIIRKKKKLRGVFDKNDCINYTVEEFEKLIQFPDVYKRLPDEYELKKSILSYSFSIKYNIKRTNKLSTLELVETEIKLINETIKRRYERLSDRLVKMIDDRIWELERKKQVLLEDDEIDFK